MNLQFSRWSEIKQTPRRCARSVQSEGGQFRAGGSGKTETVWDKVVLGSDKQAIKVAEVHDGDDVLEMTMWRLAS